MPKSKANELALFAQYLNSNGQLNAITMSIDGLTDVDTTTTAPTNGQTLVWDGSNFVPGAGGGGGSSISNTNEITEGTDNSVGESSLGAADGTNNLFYTDARVDARIALQVGSSLDLSGKSTSDLSEGTNLYYTDARADARIAAATSDDVSEGSTNLYFTDERVDDRINALMIGGTNITLSYDDANNTFTINGDITDTDDLTEGSTNLYYTNARADARIAAANLADLNNVATTAPTDGQALVYSVSNTRWQPGTISGYATSDFNTDFAAKSTSDLSEGTNLYYTDARVDTHLNQSNPTAGYVLSWNGSDYAWIDNTGYTAFDTDFDTRLATKDTGDLSEGTNLYYTDARVQTYIDGARDYGNITIVSTDAGSSAGPDLVLYRNSASPASADYIGQIQFTGKNSNGGDEIYAKVTGKITDPTLSSEDGLIETAIKGGGSFTIVSRQMSDKLYLLNGVGLSVAGDMDLFGTLNSHTIPGGTGTLALTSDLYTDSDVATYISGNRTYGNITTTGYIAGPATFTIDPAAVGDNTGTVVIAGNLQVDGTTTTINSTTLAVDDLNITVASGAANAAAANGAGLTVDGASATLTYVNPGDNWAFNKPLDMGANNITTTGKVLFANMYATTSDLPSATTYHGMFAHVHATGKGYFAHGGNWIELANASEIPSNTDSLAEGSTNLYYTDARADARIAAATTDDLSEGSTNLYYTDARVDTHLNQSSAGSNQVLSWNGSDYAWVAQTSGYGDSNVDTHLNTSTATSGQVLSWTGTDYDWVADSGIALTDLSVGTEATASGDGAIAYNNSNGVFTYTPPVLSGLTGDTDDISEGSTNQYFTSARVQAENLGGSLAGTISDAKMQYATSYSGTAVQGSFFFDSLNAKVKVYNGSAFVDAVPASGGGGGGSGTDANTTFRKYIYTTTSATNSVSGKDDVVVTAGSFVEGYQYEIISVGTTDFTAIGASANTVGVTFTATGTGSGTGTAGHILNYATNGTENVEVYVNGIKQVEGSSYDYVATTGTSVNFVSNFASGDVVDIQVYELLTNDAYYTKTETYTQTETNSQISTAVAGYLPLTGGTLTDRPVLNYDNPEIRFEDTNTSNTGEITLDNTALRFEADPDNAVASSAIKMMVDGSVKLYIGSNGKVGIGTENPSNDLHVQQSADDTNGGIQVRNSANASGMFMYVDASNHGHIDMGSAGNLEFRTGNTDRMFIKQAGKVSIGSLDNQSFGLLQVNQTSDVDEGGIGILNSTTVRSMRLYVNSNDRSVINSGDGGGQGLVLNEGGGEVNFGTNSTANNGHVQLSYGTTVTDPPTLIINAPSQSTTSPGDVYGQIIFRVNNAAGVSASGLANTDSDSVAMITAQDWRDGTGKTNEDSGIGFYTSSSSGTLTFRGGFANNGHFGIGTKNNTAGLARLLSLSDPDPSIYAIDTDNNAYNEIIMQDGQMDYRADQGNTQGSSCHVWRVDGTQVAYLNGDGMRFGNTTNAVNALDDYEEGTFSVTLTDGTNSASKDFKYVKVGRCVNIQGPTGAAQYWVLSASGTGAGTNLSFSGNLPFTPVDNGGIVSSAQRAIRQSNGTDFGTGVMPVLGWRDGSTQMYLDHTGREHTYEFANDCERDSTRTNIVMQFNGWYYTNS